MALDLFRVPDVSCDQCVRAITQAVGALPGVRLVTVSLADKSVRVEHDGNVDPAALIRAINAAGYQDVSMLV